MALKQAMTPEFRVYQRQVVANCKALAAALLGMGYHIVTGKYSSRGPLLHQAGRQAEAWF